MLQLRVPLPLSPPLPHMSFFTILHVSHIHSLHSHTYRSRQKVLLSHFVAYYPKITTKIRIAPLRGASGIEIVILGKLVGEFENCPNFIDTFLAIKKKISDLRPI